MAQQKDKMELLIKEINDIKLDLAHRREVSKIQTELIDLYYKQAKIEKKKALNLYVIFSN